MPLLALPLGMQSVVADKRNCVLHFVQTLENDFEHLPCWSRQAHLKDLGIDQDNTGNRIGKCKHGPR
jgi:hypothetical protein